MKKMTVIYLRVSSSHQDSTHQMESIQKYANQNNLTIDKVFKDDGISAFKENYTARSGFLELLDLAQQNKVSNLLVFESSRISRQNMEFQNLMNLFTQHGVRVHSTSENMILNQHEIDSLLLSIKAFFNEKSSKETSARIKSSKELMRKQGLFQGGRCAWGFHVVNKVEVVNPKMEAIIIGFFNDYITHGRSYVSRKYNCPNRKTVLARISNIKYMPVVGEGVWKRANELRETRNCSKDMQTKGLNRSNVLFEGLLYHQCGTKLSIHKDRTKNNYYHRCHNCKGNPDIAYKKSFGRTLDANIEADVLSFLDNMNADELNIKYNTTYARSRAVLGTQIDLLGKTITDKQKTLKLANIKLERYILEDDDILIKSVSNLIASTNDEIAKLSQQLEELQMKLEELQNKEDSQSKFIQNILNAKEIYSKSSASDKKAILGVLIQKIIVRDIDDYDIIFNIPRVSV